MSKYESVTWADKVQNSFASKDSNPNFGQIGFQFTTPFHFLLLFFKRFNNGEVGTPTVESFESYRKSNYSVAQICQKGRKTKLKKNKIEIKSFF